MEFDKNEFISLKKLTGLCLCHFWSLFYINHVVNRVGFESCVMLLSLFKTFKWEIASEI